MAHKLRRGGGKGRAIAQDRFPGLGRGLELAMLRRMRSGAPRRIRPPRPFCATAAGFALLAALFPTLAAAQAETEAVVFAAASTMAPIGELAAAFEWEHGQAVRLSFAASSTLARQIVHGAEADLFLSANRRWLDHLERAKLLAAGARRDLAGNRLALIRPANRGREAQVALERPASLLNALEGLPLVMADPAHVPAGVYARAALENLGLWEPLDGRMAFAANARAVTVRVARGEAPLGITYASELGGERALALAALLPENSHAPIRYELALVEPADNPLAQAFFDYLLGDEARSVFLRHGFTSGRESFPANEAMRLSPKAKKLSAPVRTRRAHARAPQ